MSEPERWTKGVLIVCAVCLYIRTGVAESAITVIEGYAVCEDHLGYVAQGQRFASILETARRESDSAPSGTTDQEP
jgi:hypothetical protein